jgi:hypothetical protein
MQDHAVKTTDRQEQRDRAEEPPIYEPPTLLDVGNAVRLTMGSSSSDTADMARYYY